MTKAYVEKRLEEISKKLNEELIERLEKNGVVHLSEMYELLWEEMGLDWHESYNYCITDKVFTTKEELAKCFK